MSAVNLRFPVVALAAALATASCSVEPVSVPSPTGPSELALSLALSATPDVISQDGVSTSRLNIQARGADSQPVPGLPMRVDVLVELDGVLVAADYGTLSDRWPTTGTDGRASVVYKAPPKPSPNATSDTTVTLRVTPVGSNYANVVPRVVTVRLVRPGTILPPTRMAPAFTFSPSSPREHDDIFFDASSSSDPDGQIALYSWQFGDGRTGTGRQTRHSYELAGTYSVVLTVSDSYGVSVSTSPKAVSVTTSAAPVARFTVSPTKPLVGSPVVFNSAGSSATAGRRLVGFNWDLGDGTFVEGVAVQHTYQVAGTFSVVLTVTDDAGRKSTLSQTLTVEEPDAPIAAFTYSPTSPSVGNTVVFNAATSTVATGRQIVNYEWDFGDGTPPGSGVAPTHVFASAATFTVVLTVTDNTGRKGVKTVTVTVGAPPIAPDGNLHQEPLDDR